MSERIVRRPIRSADFRAPEHVEARCALLAHFLAERFPRTEMLAMVEVVRPAAEYRQLAPGQVQVETAESPPAAAGTSGAAVAPAPSTPQLAPGQVRTCSRTNPIAPGRFRVELTMNKTTHEKLMHAQALLSHRLPAGDLAQVLDHVLDLVIARLEKEKFAKASKPRAPRARREPSSWNTRLRDAAAFCETRHTASLEERVKLALSWLRPNGRVQARLVSPVTMGAP